MDCLDRRRDGHCRADDLWCGTTAAASGDTSNRWSGGSSRRKGSHPRCKNDRSRGLCRSGLSEWGRQYLGFTGCSPKMGQHTRVPKDGGPRTQAHAPPAAQSSEFRFCVGRRLPWRRESQHCLSGRADCVQPGSERPRRARD
jgi:hypothetical protein